MHSYYLFFNCSRVLFFVLQGQALFTSQANQNNLMHLVANAIQAGSGRPGQPLRLPLVVPGEVSGGQPGSAAAAVEISDTTPYETNDPTAREGNARAITMQHDQSRDRSRRRSSRSRGRSRSRDRSRRHSRGRSRRRSRSRKRRRSLYFVYCLLKR